MPDRWNVLRPFRGLAGLARLTMLSAASTSAAQERVTAFVDVAVVPMDAERVLTGQTVLIRGDRIVALGPAAQTPVPTGALRIDGRGKFLIPGLADMHVHFALLGVGKERAPTRIEVEEAVRRDLFLFVANGVTTIRNLDYLDLEAVLGGEQARSTEQLVLLARRQAAAGEIWSPRIYTSGPWRMLGDSVSVEQNLEAYRTAGYDFVKVHDETGALLDSIASAAHMFGLPLVGHVDSVQHALALHYNSIEHLTGYPGLEGVSSGLAEDTIQLPELIAATQRAGVWNVPTQTLYEIYDTNPARWPEAKYSDAVYVPGANPNYDLLTVSSDTNRVEAFVKRRRRAIKMLQDAGGRLLVGTDVPQRVAGFGVHRELQALVTAGLTPYQALTAGTRNVAAYFGTLDSVGTVAVGKRADLVLLPGNPLADIRHTTYPTGVMVGGRWMAWPEIARRLEAYYATGSAER